MTHEEKPSPVPIPGRPRRPSPTTEFESLARRVLLHLHPGGSAHNHFRASANATCYHGGVKPDFVLPDGRWLDFKYRVSFREKHDVPWRPSALYSSLRKYIDHEANEHGSLIIVYRHLHGSIQDIQWPITRGRTVLLHDAEEFQRRIQLVDIERVLKRIEGTQASWLATAIRKL